ncbi:unnamed protein product [Rangifer tarandus platyrhynchus]|uniref:Uncharacterized protein n=1 Tax=Rangifer tarandus platyrhynchus TaxID=3082113 RepID=A0AC59YCK5_RANTA
MLALPPPLPPGPSSDMTSHALWFWEDLDMAFLCPTLGSSKGSHCGLGLLPASSASLSDMLAQSFSSPPAACGSAVGTWPAEPRPPCCWVELQALLQVSPGIPHRVGLSLGDKALLIVAVRFLGLVFSGS